MNGQLNLFDMRAAEERRRPCAYDFQRYIGQRVRFCGSCLGTLRGTVGTITKIDPYYTLIDTAFGTRVGTPTTIEPAEEESEEQNDEM